jgi:hypothetical protein
VSAPARMANHTCFRRIKLLQVPVSEIGVGGEIICVMAVVCQANGSELDT